MADMISKQADFEEEEGEELAHKTRFELPDSYFPMRTACDVTLYQDAHTPDNPLYHDIRLPSGEAHSPTSAFKDMVTAIRGAKHFIYLTGWSVYTKTLMLRVQEDEHSTIGELLKEKAEEGVCVLGMIWGESLFASLAMETHSKETVKYFANTKVKMVRVPREVGGILTDPIARYNYSHHQKSIVMDADGSGGDEKRRIVAFVGGLDLTDGRWDMPTHPLFSTLKTYHLGDFYNSIAKVRPDVGPREPWHDTHSRVQGRIAYDVVQNFVERWHKQVAKFDDMLVAINEDEYGVDDVGGTEHSDLWSVQMFRSINTDSAVFNPLRSLDLSGGKELFTDDSIHRAYLHHIGRAKHFLYIENQYFNGGSNIWLTPDNGSVNQIPVEITEKIIKKIQGKRRFAAYIVVPMHPEGDPASDAVQEMLYWQKCTMEMMYTRIAKELNRLERDEKPTDYLNFYCLGTREKTIPDDLEQPEPNSQEETLRKTKRFMVYLHSKMLISDDETIIVGSANLNQRSLDGNRDTEIAIAAKQKKHNGKKGKVHAFRLALWAEHLACMDDVFLNPASLECVKEVNTLAAKNWDYFTSETVLYMKGHLLPYPVQIKEDGIISGEKFPDTNAAVTGKKSFIPDIVTRSLKFPFELLLIKLREFGNWCYSLLP